MILVCPICFKKHEKSVSAYNASIKRGGIIYCGKTCSGIGRRTNKTKEQLKAEKSEYDRKRLQGEKRQLILDKKKAYHEANKDIILPKQRAYNRARMPMHIIYCRQPEQRTKERIRNRIKNGLTELKKCLLCKEEKQKIEFESYLVFPDKRNYMCRACERKQNDELKVSTREVLGCIRAGLVKHKSKLKIKDVAMFPYLIESHKYLLLLKRLTK